MKSFPKGMLFVAIIASSMLSGRLAGEELTTKNITQEFKGLYGQVEVGGRYAGFEFHKSWPTPSRISFYYPVANSIEFSDDYWKRYNSMPFDIRLKAGNDKEVQLGREPYAYAYVPYGVTFSRDFNGYKASFEYNFCETIPAAVMTITITSTSKTKNKFDIDWGLRSSIHTCHTYTLLDTAKVSYTDDKTAGITDFTGCPDARSAALFVVNAGLKPVSTGTITGDKVKDPRMSFGYTGELASGDSMKIILVIGMCAGSETVRMITVARTEWEKDVRATESRILEFVNQDNFTVSDPVLMETSAWSKAMIASLIHYIDGDFIPMPCPAEYNFFFTHDLLVTGLGVVLFDPEFVKHGYDFLLKYYDKDKNILEHAYYWKDGKFVTEYCSESHWNNLWFIISVGSYLKHTNDTETASELYPIMKVSLDRILTSMNDEGLLDALYPDWWDAGKVYGARAYISILSYRAIQEFVYTSIKLNMSDDTLLNYLDKAREIRLSLNNKLWDNDKKYLMNELTNGKMDDHYYIGSLLAPAYDAIDKDIAGQLLDTARKKLLDEKLGIRVAMPMDYDKLENVYKFVNHEEGMPGYYFNGAIWPQGNIWYAISLIANGQPDKAEEVIRKYITIAGIKNSPNGTPSFYETRITAENTPEYGQIDKPSFLWQGGWYFYILYQLAGLRENPWNIYFVPEIPADFTDARYKVTLEGELCDVTNSGKGRFFKSIEADGARINSSVVTDPAKKINLVRGIPDQPYLAEAGCLVRSVRYSPADKSLSLEIDNVIGQIVQLKIVSPLEFSELIIDDEQKPSGCTQARDGDVNILSIKFTATLPETEVIVNFK